MPTQWQLLGQSCWLTERPKIQVAEVLFCGSVLYMYGPLLGTLRHAKVISTKLYLFGAALRSYLRAEEQFQQGINPVRRNIFSPERICRLVYWNSRVVPRTKFAKAVTVATNIWRTSIFLTPRSFIGHSLTFLARHPQDTISLLLCQERILPWFVDYILQSFNKFKMKPWSNLIYQYNIHIVHWYIIYGMRMTDASIIIKSYGK